MCPTLTWVCPTLAWVYLTLDHHARAQYDLRQGLAGVSDRILPQVTVFSKAFDGIGRATRTVLLSNRLFNPLDLYYKTPESGDLGYRSSILKNKIRPHQ